MRKFSVLRYVKQFSLLILLLSVAGSMAIYYYGRSQQRYIASAVIQYTNGAAKDGYTPDGSPLNVEEIYSSAVIDAALKDLGYQVNVDTIRSNCYVEEVIPEARQKLIDALLERGEESSFVADTYRVFFVADSASGMDYAWNVLDAIIKNYFEFYTEKYVEEQLPGNGAAALAEGDYDFLESAQVLENSVSQMLDYLLSQRASNPYFRSIETGYTYSDLYGVYNYLYNYEIPGLYATILANAETNDIETLMSRLQRDCEEIQLLVENREQRVGYLRQLIDTFTERNKDLMDYHYHSSNSQDLGTEYILKDVENYQESADQETTYDGLIQEYVDLNIEIRQKKNEKEHTEYLLSVFEAAISDPGRKTISAEEIQSRIDRCVRLATAYYRDVEETGRELNRHRSANYLTTVSSINVQSSINLTLYLVIALVLFAVVGVIGAVLLGRLLDFMDYLLYIDKTVDLPNRARCDAFIEEQSERLLQEHFACLVLRMVSLSDVTREFGRQTGDAVLKDFGQIVKSFCDLYGFVGYNDGGVFLAFLPDCPSSKLSVICKAIDRQVAEYNKRNPGHDIRYASGKAVSDDDGAFEIRELLRLAMKRMNPA